MLIIGSVSLHEYDALPRNRAIGDTDYISEFDEFTQWCDWYTPDMVRPVNNGKKYIARVNNEMHEFEIAWDGTTAKSLLELTKDKVFIIGKHGYRYADPELNLTLKLSHRFLKNSPHFRKTMDDILHLTGHSIKVPEYLAQWLKDREKATYNYGHPSLRQSKKDFFSGDGVGYVYDHDSIHMAVKRGKHPAYSYFKDDQAEVFCSREKFEKQPKRIRVDSVIEESYVLAIERCLVHYDDITPQIAFSMALEKVCTSLTSGWYREFAYNHYYDAINNYHPGYYDHFRAEVQRGNVALHPG